MSVNSTEITSIRDLFRSTYRRSFFDMIGLLLGAYLLEHYANIYAFSYSLRPTSTHVGDIVLDNIPAIDLNFLIIETALISFVVGLIFILFYRPRYILFALKALAFFVVVRAIFTSLTHVGIYPDHIAPGLGFFSSIYTYLNLQTGFFFSGHTGLPFLMAFIFWREWPARIIFLTLSFVFGTAVLLAHIHYSIDVLAAPFMAYGIFKIVQYLFPRDYALTQQ